MSKIDLMKTFTEGTFIPVSLVIVAMGGMMWLTTLYAKTEANALTLTKIEQKQDAYNQSMELIIRKLTRIEGKLNLE